jgi:1A family penicillin-binding protein
MSGATMIRKSDLPHSAAVREDGEDHGLPHGPPLGAPMPAAAPPPRRRWGRRVLWTIVSAVFVSAIALLGLLAWTVYDLPFARVVQYTVPPVIVLEDADGNELARQGDVRGPAAQPDEIPQDFKNAVVAVEDRRFHDHFGVDLRGILRATLHNASAGQFEQGGSTITQQLVRSLHLDNARTLRRKVREATLAVWLELHRSKEEILAQYVNTIYYGAGAHGISAAARVYFGKDVADLTLEESAMLAGIVNAPSTLNPLVNPDRARARALLVLNAMVASGRLDAERAAAARLQLASLAPIPERPAAASWFADWVYEEAAKLAPFVAGTDLNILRVRTTLDPELQALAESTVAQALDEHGARINAREMALVAMRPDGAVVAMVGGASYNDSQFNRAVQALRQPGSTFKLFVYYAALRNGYSLDDTIEDAPLEIDGWKPENFSGRYHGRVTLEQAFVNSLNSATARLAQAVGIDAVVDAARELGIDADLSATPSLALGTSEVSLLDLTGAYASVRAGVAPLEPWAIEGFGSGDEGRFLAPGPQPEPRHSLQPHRQELVALLRRTVERGTGRGADLEGEFAAGKTGTSEEHRDAWFIGFTDDLVVGVWVGNDDNTPMEGTTGGSVPATIWKRFMSQAFPSGDDDAPAGQDDDPLLTVSDLEDDLVQEGRCDIGACSSAYRSFRASDCTYQPYYGPRRLCTRGNRDADGLPFDEAREDGLTALDDDELQDDLTVLDGERQNEVIVLPDERDEDAQVAQSGYDSGSQGNPACDIDACSAAYDSFRASDCTYRSFEGERRLCRRGNDREARRSRDGRRVSDNRQAQVYSVAPGRQGYSQTGARSCNFSACASTYRSFDPADCTYQPYDGGGRRLCEK